MFFSHNWLGSFRRFALLAIELHQTFMSQP